MARRWSVALLVMALTGCGNPLPSATPAPTSTPQASPARPPLPTSTAGDRALVLRLDAFVGAPLQGVTVEMPPLFSLYSDGEAIYTVGTSLDFDLRHAQLSESQLDSLLAEALDRGGLRDAQTRYDDVSFESTHTFEIRAQGIAKQVTVTGLGFADAEAPSAAERAKFASLADRLSNFDTEVEAGIAQNLGRYIPGAYRAALHEPFVPEMTANAEWPWPDIAPSRLIPFGLITGEQGEAVVRLGVERNLIARAPGGALYQITVRPLLPDEVVIHSVF